MAIILGKRTVPCRIRMSITEEAWTLNAKPSKIDPSGVPQQEPGRDQEGQVKSRGRSARGVRRPEWRWAQPGTISRDRISGSGRGMRSP